MKGQPNIRGSRVTRHRAPSQFGTNRICVMDGCETVLSRYNRLVVCHQHSPTTFPVTRGFEKKAA